MKRLIVFAHNDLSKSNVSSNWLQHLQAKKDESNTIICLDQELVNGNFDIAKHREIIRQHDAILVVFPVYWYSHPHILQKYLEQVLTGNDNADFVNELRQHPAKQFMIAVSGASSQANYTLGGLASFPIEMQFANFLSLANYCNLKWLPMYWVLDVHAKSEQQLTQACEDMYDKFVNPIIIR
ncbi:MAG: NAD(P)H-dependent oxidoreductase [Clostridiales bacterium]|jgi:putative NADPH-quinone reductase|nr:NAD(P)H-dependent oxidoreductase [Clostridiales bacterium]